MNSLYAKHNGENLYQHTKKVLDGVKRLKKALTSANEIFTDDFWKYLEYAAVAHDFGKAHHAFQDYIKRFIKDEKGDEKSSPKRQDIDLKIPHSLMSPIFFNWFGLDITDEWRKIILSAIVFHHDRSEIYNLLSGGNIPPATAEELAALKYEFRDLLREYDSLLASDIKTINRRFTKFLLAPQNVILNDSLAGEKMFDFAYRKRYIFFKGLLHRADHFASSLEKDDDDVENIEIEPLPIAEIETALQTEISSSAKIGMNLKETWQYKKLHEKNLNGKNTILIGATGIGKTEFAFLWAAGKKLFFTLPMRTMTNEIFKRAAKVFDKKRVGLMHSSAAAVLPGILHNVKEGETADVEWHISLSRNLSYPVIVSTGDQVLNVSLKYPTYEKIMSTLGYSNLVIDEIQAYSPETSAIIVKTIEDVVRLGGKFLLMTATLPEYIKKEIIERTNIPEQDIFTILSKQGDKDIIKNKIYLEKADDNKKEEKPDKTGKTEKDKDLDAFYQKVREIILQNRDKKILVTINTVRNAQQIYKRIKDDAPLLSGLFIKPGNVMLIHSRFIGRDREAKINQLISKKVKTEKPEIKILVSTQVIEASVNIDFDILITELAPLDSLIQRMGRVNRNRGEFSEEKGQGLVYIIDKILPGSDKIYKGVTLKLTGKFLNEESIHNRALSEEKKLELLDKYFTDKDYDEIEKQFRKNLDAMDNLLLASSKSEAQRIFREVNSVTIIPKELIKEFSGKLAKTGINKFDIRKLLLDYSLSIPYNSSFYVSKVDLGRYIADQDRDRFTDLRKRFNIRRFFNGYFVVRDKNWLYNGEIGFFHGMENQD